MLAEDSVRMVATPGPSGATWDPGLSPKAITAMNYALRASSQANGPWRPHLIEPSRCNMMSA